MGGVALTGQFATAAGEQEKIVLYALTLFLLGVRRGVGSAKSQNFDNGGYDQPARSRLPFWVPSVYLLAGNRIAGPPSRRLSLPSSKELEYAALHGRVERLQTPL